jgi:hypothetical protein
VTKPTPSAACTIETLFGRRGIEQRRLLLLRITHWALDAGRLVHHIYQYVGAVGVGFHHILLLVFFCFFLNIFG